MSELSEHTPSQAEGDRDDDEWTVPEVPHSTPSQAEGERDQADVPTAAENSGDGT